MPATTAPIAVDGSALILSTRLSERKVCSMPGFPRIVTGFTRGVEGQRRAAASGAPLLKYRWEAAVAGYGPADDCSDVFARWTAQGGRSGQIMPRVWHGLTKITKAP